MLKSRFRKGYGIHSPFVFDLVRELVYCKHSFYAYEKIALFRRKLMRSKQVLTMSDYGAGSSTFKTKKRNVSELVSKTSVTKKYGELLFRLVNHFNPDTVLELGTSIGMSTAYLALSNTKRKVYSIEACDEMAQKAKEGLQNLGCNNVNQIIGQFCDVLPDLLGEIKTLDFVFFDGHHQKQATLDYFHMCLLKVSNDSVFVFDDIHWSKGMDEAWNIICENPAVTVSMDLFQFGIVFFRKECQKQHFIVKY